MQVGELLLAFGLSSLVGLERQLRSKSAGLRTQTIVGTASALLLLISKYGFSDVLVPGHVVLDPSRIAAQIVSGVGFLGAGLILTRRGAIRGLTTAAAVWETAAIGMAAGAGLWLLALVVTALHFVIVLGYTALIHALGRASESSVLLDVAYARSQGLLPRIITRITESGWSVRRLQEHDTTQHDRTTVQLELVGPADFTPLLARIADIDGVHSIAPASTDDLE